MCGFNVIMHTGCAPRRYKSDRKVAKGFVAIDILDELAPEWVSANRFD
jgi:hypothetical protein